MLAKKKKGFGVNSVPVMHAGRDSVTVHLHVVGLFLTVGLNCTVSLPGSSTI